MEKYRRVRINVLFSEYLNDTTIPHRTRAIETHKEIMWNLVNHLLLKHNKKKQKSCKEEHLPNFQIHLYKSNQFKLLDHFLNLVIYKHKPNLLST